MGIAQDRFEQLVAEHLAPALKDRGYSRNRSNFRRRVDGVWGVVNVQRNPKASTAKSLSFTVNLGVASERLQKLQSIWRPGKAPTEPDCHIRERLGFLLPDRGDRWWVVDRRTDVEQLGSTIAGAIVEYGLPFIEPLLSDEAIRDYWLTALREDRLDADPTALIQLLAEIGSEHLIETVRERYPDALGPY